jgi:hypothetical protein
MKTVHRAVLVPWFALGLAAGCQGSTALLGPGAAQGIEGQALLGPTCPVQRADSTCADQPYQAWFTVAGVRGGQVARFQGGTDGRFRVGLEPGTYVLHPGSGNPYPRAGDDTVKVEPGTYTSVTIHFDSGIR